MSGPVELVRSLTAAYGQAMDCIDGGCRTPDELEARVVPAVEALEIENARLRAIRETALRWYNATDVEELQHAVAELRAAVRLTLGEEQR